ncbi:MAG: alkylation response protein AidB-like acyl-CoA dehydrogenase [Gammaproteobacteria bacterium]|jgi:alkylation response protein AidB-like acyl-CoA dehydrogenase
MNFDPSSEQTLIHDATQAMVGREIRPIMDAHDLDTPLPKEALLRIFAVLAKQGLTAPRVPADAGGGGLKMLDYGMMFELLPPEIAFALLGQEVTIARIYAESTAQQRERFLPDLIAGKKICCTGTTEPNMGSNPREVQTRVVEDGDELVINGAKMWITNVAVCDLINVTCNDGLDDKGRGRLRRVLVERDVSPFETRDIECLGLRQGHLGEARFDDCRVPKDNSLGTSGDAAKVLTLTWNGNRPLIGLIAVGLAQKALDAAIEYAGSRRQFGKLLGGHQLVQANLADIETAVVSSRLLCYSALDAIDKGKRANGSSAMAKRYATNACEQAISLAMQVHGAMGIGRETGLERLYRDVRMLPIPDGANNILALIQGRDLVGIDAFR